MKCKATLAFVLFSVVSFACYGGQARVGQGVLDKATVESRSVTPGYSGIVATWVVLTVTRDGRAVELLYPYFEDKSPGPAVGDVCDFSFHAERVSGQAGGRMVNDVSANLIDEAKCAADA
ncbi:hypothetical protein [Lysobacter enzymogenes]|uniref:hypothetical protein n=1 Tax=Lysobacter enzymogenes TaxID=69 RepID=UPI000F4B4A98|nr:hypothetical protein [Lysobacter enzymogenes]